jgi:NitT/TauT family transport system substrate-binding protein
MTKLTKYLAALLVVSAAATPMSRVNAQTAEPIKIGVGVDAAFVPMYLSKQRKLFEKHGLNVELVQFTQGGEAIDAIVAGQVQMGGSAQPTVLIRAARADVKVFGIFGQSGTYIKLVTKPDITDPKQIKSIGIVPGSVSEYATERLFAKFGIDPKSVQLVRVGPPEAPALLVRGDIDGYFLWEPWPSNGVKQGGKILLTDGEVGFVDNMWLAADGAWFAGHKPEAKAVLDTLAEACAIVRADPAVGAAAVQAEAKIPAEAALNILKDRECIVRDFTQDDMESYDKIADFLVSHKITPAKVDVGKVIQRGFYAAN